jgi:tetratricopeptide (TPR) repeat protein
VQTPTPLPRQHPLALVVVTPALPTAPSLAPLIRPRSGGDALRLADRALEQGDALDAAAQYRAVLATAPAIDAPYAQVQLARALLQLDQRAAAVELLEPVAASGAPEAWPALKLLADLRMPQRGPLGTLADLSHLAGANLPRLEALVVQRAPREEAAAMLLGIALQTRSLARACSYTLAAVDRVGVDRLPFEVRHGRCRHEIDAHLGLPPRSDLPGADEAVVAWDRARLATAAGRLDPLVWLEAARAYARVEDASPGVVPDDVVLWNAYTAWHNAVVVAVLGDHVDIGFLHDSFRVLSHLGPYRPRGQRVLEDLSRSVAP